MSGTPVTHEPRVARRLDGVPMDFWWRRRAAVYVAAGAVAAYTPLHDAEPIFTTDDLAAPATGWEYAVLSVQAVSADANKVIYLGTDAGDVWQGTLGAANTSVSFYISRPGRRFGGTKVPQLKLGTGTGATTVLVELVLLPTK